MFRSCLWEYFSWGGSSQVSGMCMARTVLPEENRARAAESMYGVAHCMALNLRPPDSAFVTTWPDLEEGGTRLA